MDGEEEGGQGGREPGEEAARQLVVEQRHASVQENIDGVVTQGGNLSQQVIETEGEDSDGPVGLVALLLGDGSPPEIILENVPQWNVGSQVPAGRQNYCLTVALYLSSPVVPDG